MVAHQTASNAFAVVDNNTNTVFHHKGSTATPRSAQAAFNSHAAIRGEETGLCGWRSRDWITSPDPRYRQIVRAFADAGYLDEESDEYNPRQGASQNLD